MWTPTCTFPFGSRVSERASSKSFASRGSMVKVIASRISFRLATSSGVIPASILSAAFTTFSGYRYGRPNSARIACISASLFPVSPRMSTTSPIGELLSSCHSIMRTIALSPLFPPLSLFLGMKISVARNLLSVSRVAKYLSTCRVPINTWSFFSIISITSASGSWPRRWALMCTFTLSPFRACIELRSATKIDSSPSLISTLFLPLLRRTKVPIETAPRCLALNLPGVTSVRVPSSAICSRISTTSARFAGVEALTAADTCL